MDFLAIILFFWALWLSKQTGAPRWLRFVPPALVISFFGGFFGTLWGLARAFKGVEGLAPSEKAHALADGISRAMVFTAANLSFDAVVLVVLVTMTWSLRRRAFSGRTG